MFQINPPYALFLADAKDRVEAKTAYGVFYWRPERCLAQITLPGCRVDLGLPGVTPMEAARLGAQTLVVGLAPQGGKLPDAWVAVLTEALEAGLDIANGLHTRLADVPALRAAAARTGRRILDVRHPTGPIEVGSYRRRSGRRLLTVGTDCAVGKMFTALAIEKELHARGVAATFRATGQTGILIAGNGICVDAVVADFISGAAEALSPDNRPDHWDLVEGQGSLFHPSYAGVSLGLLHGSQPDALVLCHDAARPANGDFADLPLPSLEDCAALNLQLARLVNPDVRLVGVSLNTSALTAAAAQAAIDEAAKRLNVPAADPVRTGVANIVDRLLVSSPSRLVAQR